jgi:hypothetical protein
MRAEPMRAEPMRAEPMRAEPMRAGSAPAERLQAVARLRVAAVPGWLAPHWSLFAVKLTDQRRMTERGSRANPKCRKLCPGTGGNASQQSRGLQYSAVAERESAFSRVGITPSYGFR